MTGQPRYAEAKRLLEKSFKLVALHQNSKRPIGDGWNLNPVQDVDPNAGGYGVLLNANGLCSVDPDSVDRAREGMLRCGFDLEALMNAGVRTSSTRPGSGGRSTFKAPPGARWLKFASKKHGTILELRAASPNLQDCLAGTVYFTPAGKGPYRQDYANGKRIDEAPDLPPEVAAWWLRMSEEFEYLREQQGLFVGPDAMLSVSSGDGTLAYSSPLRSSFNDATEVSEILQRHGYTEGRGGRWAPPTASGAPAVRAIPGKVGLWQSDHASDPLFGTFDAWTAYVTLDHEGKADSAAAAWSAVGLSDNIDPPGHIELPNFARTKSGEIPATKSNIAKALSRPDVCGFQIRNDLFRAETMLAEYGTDGWRMLKDTDYVELALRLEGGKFQSISKETMRDVVAYIADGNSFDSAQHWLGGRQWDGQQRIERFLVDYFSAADTPYTRAVSLYLWTALSGRVLEPGVKCDMAPVAVGPQGARKSTAVAAIAPAADFFSTMDLGTSDDNMARLMRGKLVIELDELKGLSTRDADFIKSLMTRRVEEWIPKYREMTVRYLRRSVFIGTSNRDDFLGDETGNRRWLPFRCGVCNPDASRSAINDTESIIAGLDKLKAQGIDTGQVLTVSLGKAINTADSQKAIEAVRAQIESLRKVLGDKLADGLLDQAKQKTNELKDAIDKATPGINSLREAYALLGLKTSEELSKIANANKAAWEEIRKDGTASATTLKSAFEVYAASAIAATGAVGSSQRAVTEATLKTEAAVKGLSVSFDENGKLIVSTQAEAAAAVARTTEGIHTQRAAVDSVTSALERQNEALERAISAQEKSNALAARAADLENKRLKRDNEGFSVDANGKRITSTFTTLSERGIFGQAKESGLTDEQALSIASRFIEQSQKPNDQLNAPLGEDFTGRLQKAIDEYVLINARKAAEAERKAKTDQPQVTNPTATTGPTQAPAATPAPAPSAPTQPAPRPTAPNLTINLAAGVDTSSRAAVEKLARAIMPAIEGLQRRGLSAG